MRLKNLLLATVVAFTGSAQAATPIPNGTPISIPALAAQIAPLLGSNLLNGANANTATATANGNTLSLALWMSYLSGTSNPYAIQLGNTLGVTGYGTFGSGMTINNSGANPWQFSGTSLSLTGSGNPNMFVKVPNSGAMAFQVNGTTELNITGAQVAVTPPLNANGALKSNSIFQSGMSPVYVTGSGINTTSGNLPVFWFDNALSGALDTGSATPFFIRTRDTIASSLGGANGLPAVNIDQELNAGYDGFRNAFVVHQNKNASSASGNSVMNAVSLFGNWQGNEGGTSTANWKGGGTYLNVDVTCAETWQQQCINGELDIRTTQQAQQKSITIYNYAINDAAHGLNEDNSIRFSASSTIAPGTGRGLELLSIGCWSCTFPLDPSAANTGAGTAFMRVHNNVTGNVASGGVTWPDTHAVGYGFDLKAANFTQYAWQSSGFWIDGTGQEFIGPGSITYNSSGLTIAAANVTEQTAVVVAGGSGYNNGDQVMDTIGGLWTVTTTGAATNTTAATLTLLRAGFASSCPSSPTALSGGYGINATATITCSSAAGTVTINGLSGSGANLTSLNGSNISSGQVAVAQGGTGLGSGTSGGVLAYTATGTLASSAALTANSPVLGGGAGVVPKTIAGITTDGTSVVTLGVAGTSVGKVALNNATSGSITIAPVTGALGSSVLTLPATTDTVVTLAATQTLTNKSIAGSEINSGTVAATYLPTATSGALGVVQGDGSTLPITAGTISCATSTASQLGCAKPDNSTITATGGTYTVATATTGQLGAVKPDGTTVTISSGVISVPLGTSGVVSSTQTLNLPTGWHSVIFKAIGAGGGAGCGIVQTTGTNASGGASGGSGILVDGIFQSSITGGTQIVITPGIAGSSCTASGTANGSTGSTPTAGGNTTVTIGSFTRTAFGGGAGSNAISGANAGGGGGAGWGGAGGNGSSGTAGAAGASGGVAGSNGGGAACGSFVPSSCGGTGSVSGLLGQNANSVGVNGTNGPGVGGSGAGINATPAALNGGLGRSSYIAGGATVANGVNTCTGTSQNGANGAATTGSGSELTGNGGGGGASCISGQNGGNGGNATGFGATGGGGGSVLQDGTHIAGNGGTSTGGAVWYVVN